jgi:hypothetical protein
MEVARFWLELAAVDLRLRALPYGFNRCFIFPEGMTPTPTPSARDIVYIEKLVGHLGVAASLSRGMRGSCLRRALVLKRRLAARGIAADLVFGAARVAGVVRGHAWLEAGDLRIDAAAGSGAGPHA